MIRLFVIFATAAIIFFGAMALSPALIDETGYILISFAGMIIETNIVSAITLLTLLFIVLFFTIKFLRGGLKLSFGAWNKIAFASRRRGIVNFNKGLAAFILEDYPKAEHLFAKSAEPAQREQSAYLLAAAAASKQSLKTNTDHYLALLEQLDEKIKVSGLETVLVQIKLLMNHKAYAKARTLIDAHHKHIGHDEHLLALEINLCLIEKRFDAAIERLISARKLSTKKASKSISQNVLNAWEEQAFYGKFNDLIKQHDQNNLQEYWKSLARKLKQREAITFAYCQVLAQNNIIEPLEALILPTLKKQPSDSFLKQLRNLPIKHAESLITTVQKHLHKTANDPKWLSCLGHLAAMSEQWSMAEKAFNSLVRLEGQQYDKQDLKVFAQTLIAQNNHQTATEVLLQLHELDK